jgi:flagellar hook-basal body complex protein FliE
VAISPIPSGGGFARPAPTPRTSLVDPAGQAGKALSGSPLGGSALGGPTGTGFADQVTDALASVERSQQVADGLAQQAATGTLSDVHDYMIASTQAQLATELTVAVRNRALESFQTIMNLQV